MYKTDQTLNDPNAIGVETATPRATSPTADIEALDPRTPKQPHRSASAVAYLVSARNLAPIVMYAGRDRHGLRPREVAQALSAADRRGRAQLFGIVSQQAEDIYKCDYSWRGASLFAVIVAARFHTIVC